jgi:hypothetical protein
MKTQKQSSLLSRGAFLRSLALGAPLLSTSTLLGQSSPAPAPAADRVDLGNLRAFVELARSEIRTQKGLIFAQNIPFTEDEAAEFWPLQHEYDAEFTRLLDLRYAGLLEFFQGQSTMTDTQANDLARRAFDLEAKRTELKRKYFKKFKKVIPAVKAARFFQIENQINLAIDLQIAASLPLIQ